MQGYLVTLGNGQLNASDLISGNLMTFNQSQALGSGSWTWSGTTTGGASVSNQTANGNYVLGSDGNVYFVPNAGPVGTITTASAATAPTYNDAIFGTNANNTAINGNGDADVIYGGASTSETNTGNDTVNAGAGNDTVIAGDGNDVIRGGGDSDSLFGGAGNDTIYGDNQTAPATGPEDLNWTAQGANGASLANGFTQDTGGMQVTFAYQDTGAGTGATVNTQTEYRAPGETYSTTSALALNGTGNGPTSTIGFSFDAEPGSNLSDQVSNVSFRINDVDTGAWIDVITVRAWDINGNPVAVVLTAAGNDVVTGQTVTSGPGGDTAASFNGSVLVTIAGPVHYFEVVYSNADAGSQVVYVTDVQFTTLTPADGDDVIDGGAGNDTIFGGGGNDSLAGGQGNDSLYGGTGADQIAGGEGADLIQGGDGNDSIAGDGGDDSISGDAGDDIIDGGAGIDRVYGGAGNDTVKGGADSDTVDGGIGDDKLFGGDGTDTLFGGDGRDTLSGDGGVDTLTGGAGADVFIADGTADLVTDFDVTGGIGDGNQTNNDFVDLTQFYNPTTLAAWNAANPGQQYATPLGWLRADQADGVLTGAGGFRILNGGSAVPGAALNAENTGVVCFTRGTQITTSRGNVLIEDLALGDMILTMDHGYQPLRWIGTTRVPATGALAPILIRKGALGNTKDLRVSPQHRMLLTGWRAELLTGEEEVLAAAKHLVNDFSITRDEGGMVDYFHMLFDRHEIVFAEDCPSESFHPGRVGWDVLAHEARQEIITLFPDLALGDFETYGASARSTLKPHEARLIGEMGQAMPRHG